MKSFVLPLFCILSAVSFSQTGKAPNIFIITTDGFRWQEIFKGADSAIISDPHYVKDTGLIKEMFWNEDIKERRKMLMPFVWGTLEKHGSLYGNRDYDNKVSVSNPYCLSYPGYNEILTGYADPAIIANLKKWNSNKNLLQFLNEQPEYSSKVAAFASWNLFNYILNKQKSNVYINSGYQPIRHDSLLSGTEILINAFQQYSVDNAQNTRNDMLTFLTAKEYIHTHHPKVVFISFGETDEYAHGSNYDGYLQSAHLFDEYLSQLWYLVNKDPFYKNNTSFIITTDHGRGHKSNTWVRHGLFTAGSSNTWLMTLGPGFDGKGEIKMKTEIFSNQLVQAIAGSLGYTFSPSHHVNNPGFSFWSDTRR